MFSSLSSFVSPKAWLASYLAQNLAEWFHVDPSAIETNLFQESGISLKNVTTRHYGGHIESIKLNWAWSSTGITDVTLHVCGVNIVISPSTKTTNNAEVDTNRDESNANVENAQQREQKEPADASSWKTKYFQQIMDHLTVVVTNVCISLEVDKDTSVDIKLERANLQTLAENESKLDQRLELVELRAYVRKLEQDNDNKAEWHELALIDEWSGAAQITRVSGRRFVDGFVTGLLIQGYQSTPINVHIGPVQAQAVLSLVRETMGETGDSTTTFSALTKQQDSSQLKLQIPSIGCVLENGIPVSFRGCELSYHFDASVCTIQCSGGLYLDEKPIIQSKHPLYADIFTSRVGVAQAEFEDALCDSVEQDSLIASSASVHIEFDAQQVKCLVDGIRESWSVVSVYGSEETHDVSSVAQGTSWFVDGGEQVSLKWKGADGCWIHAALSMVKARGDHTFRAITWNAIALTSSSFKLTIPSGIFEDQHAPSLRLNDLVSVILERPPIEVGTEVSAILTEVLDILRTEPPTAEDSMSFSSFELPFACAVPGVQVVVRGLNPGQIDVEQIEAFPSGSISFVTVNISGMIEGLSAQFFKVQLSSPDLQTGMLNFDVSRFVLPSVGELVEPIHNVQIALDTKTLSCDIPNDVKISFRDLPRETEKKGRGFHGDSPFEHVDIPIEIKMNLGKLVLLQHLETMKASVAVESLRVSLSPSIENNGKYVEASMGFRYVEARYGDLLVSSSHSETFCIRSHFHERLRVTVEGSIDGCVKRGCHNHEWIDFVVSSLAIDKEVSEQSISSSLPLGIGWRALEVHYMTPTGRMDIGMGACVSSNDRRKISFPDDVSIQLSSLAIATSFFAFCRDVSFISNHESSPTPTSPAPGLDFPIRFNKCTLSFQDELSQIDIAGVEARGMDLTCDFLTVGRNGGELSRIESLSLCSSIDKNATFVTRVGMENACISGFCRLSSRLDNVTLTYDVDNFSVHSPLITFAAISLKGSDNQNTFPEKHKVGISTWRLMIDDMELRTKRKDVEDGIYIASLRYKAIEVDNGNGFVISSSHQDFNVNLQPKERGRLLFEGEIGLCLRTPSDSSTDVAVDHLCLSPVDHPTTVEHSGGLPVTVGWDRLQIVQRFPSGGICLVVPSACTSQDGHVFSVLGDVSIELSSLAVLSSLHGFYNDTQTLFVAIDTGSTNEEPHRPGQCRLRMESCLVNVKDDGGQISVREIETNGMVSHINEVDFRNFFSDTNRMCLQSLSMTGPTSRNPDIHFTCTIVEASASRLFQVSSPVEKVSMSYVGNLLSVNFSVLAVDFFHNMVGAGHQDAPAQDRSATNTSVLMELPFGVDFALKAARLRYVPAFGHNEFDLWHNMNLDELKFVYRPLGSEMTEWSLACKAFTFLKEGVSRNHLHAEGIGIISQCTHRGDRVACRLCLPYFGGVNSMTLTVEKLEKLVGGGGSLCSPLHNVTAALKEGAIVVHCPHIEWMMDRPNTGDDPGKLTYPIPYPIQLVIDGLVISQASFTGKVVKLVSVGKTSLVAEQRAGWSEIRTEIVEVADFVYLSMLRIPMLSGSVTLHQDRLDMFSDAIIDIASAELTADLLSDEWNEPLSDPSDSKTSKLPNIRVSGFEISLNCSSRIATVSNAQLKVGSFVGGGNTDSKTLSDHYVKQVKKRIPYLFLKTDVLGTSVGDSVTSVAAAIATSSTIGGSVAGVVGYDAIGSAITAGKEQRGAEASDRYKFGDVSRGIAASVSKAASKGASMRGDCSYRVGDVTAGAATAAAKYTAENRVRLSSAGGSGLGMVAGLAMAGPIGMVGGALVGGKAVGAAVARMTGDPKKKNDSELDSKKNAELAEFMNAENILQNQTRPFPSPQVDLLSDSPPFPSPQVHLLSDSPAPVSQIKFEGHPCVRGRDPFLPGTDQISQDNQSPAVLSSTTVGPLSPSRPPATVSIPANKPHMDPEYQSSQLCPHNTTQTQANQVIPPQQSLPPEHYHYHDLEYYHHQRHSSTEASPFPSSTQNRNVSYPPQPDRGHESGYRFGDISRGIVARGKKSRGESSNSSYKFGDFTRGLFSGS